ncbi:hypothetical protein AB0N05_28725 [Nocardia sp. NPDC051030]|uniref:type II secretion system F family protein n=1 Tax=Nocardia sp. NPDC051030 TaxID=3155162 RepID=UPI0034497B14
MLGCVAFALVALPGPAARRRWASLFQRGRVPRSRLAWVTRAVPVLALPMLLIVGVGPLIAAVLVSGTAVIRRRRTIRERAWATECGRLLEGLEAVIGELRIGAHPSAAAEIAAQEVGGEAGRAFAVSAARSRLGGSGAEGLRRPESVVATELTWIAEAWRVAEHHGLALAELLSAARLDLLGRKRFRDRTRAALAGAHATATVLAMLPLLGIGLGQLMGAAPLRVLFTPGIGTVLLPLGAGLACTGLLWTDAITAKVLR